jgi:hypothetical protein
MSIYRKALPVVLVGTMTAEAILAGRREERENPHVDRSEFFYPSPVGHCAAAVASTSAVSIVGELLWSMDTK